MLCKDIAEQEGLLHALLRGCAGLPVPECRGESSDRAQGAPAWKAGEGLGCLPSPSRAAPQLAPGAQMLDFDQSTAVGLFGAAGKGGYNPTNRSRRDRSKQKMLCSGL